MVTTRSERAVEVVRMSEVRGGLRLVEEFLGTRQGLGMPMTRALERVLGDRRALDDPSTW
jgi:hypothetical protein